MNNFTPPSGRAGRARQMEIGKENGEAIAIWKDAMLRGLGRPWTASEEITAEAIAACFIRARRLRDQGRDDVPLLREAAILMRDSVFRHPASIPPETGGQ